jgi:chromosome segregation ATPase
MASLNPLKIRSRAAARVARMIDFRLRGHEERITEQEHCTVDHRRRLDALEAGLEQVRGDLRWTSAELDRLIPHVAAQEHQLENLRQKLAMVPPADKPELAEARSIVEEVQRQHAQVRVRLAAIARYEDRLRKLEDREQDREQERAGAVE